MLQPNWSYSDATVFLPSSFLPAEVPAEHMYSPAEFSFTVRSWDITPFLEETAPKIEAMGLFLTFNDGGWIDIETAFKETDKLAVVRIGILAAAMVIADGFAVYLFISRRKKDYGIMRALGTTKRASSKAISVPFICLSVLSIAAGTIIGFIYTKHTLYQNHAINLLENPSASAVIPGWTIACLLYTSKASPDPNAQRFVYEVDAASSNTSLYVNAEQLELTYSLSVLSVVITAGILIIASLISVAASSLRIMKLKPRDIFSKQ